MTTENKLKTTVSVGKLPNGLWVFVIKRGSVVYPAQGPFPSLMQAEAAGQAALKALQGPVA